MSKTDTSQVTDFNERAMELHRKHGGKLKIASKIPLETQDDLSLAYSPGVGAPCMAIAEDKEKVYELTAKRDTVAVVTDGSAVLGLGDIGPEASLPVMEGKALLFKRFGNVDAWPICLDTQDVEEIIRTVRLIAPGFGGINLEDIAAPRCFEIERRLQDLGIPVFHDDQDGTAIVALAGLINAAKVVGRDPKSLRVVICGAGAAGMSIARILCGRRCPDHRYAGQVILCDSKGILSSKRDDLNEAKREALEWTNPDDIHGSVHDALEGADVFMGVSKANLLGEDDIRVMNKDPIIFAMANPVPEISPGAAKAGGAAVIATGRSDYPNQVNNILAFPGMFRGLLDARVKQITPEMHIVVAEALAAIVTNPTADRVIPNVFDPGIDVAETVAEAIRQYVASC